MKYFNCLLLLFFSFALCADLAAQRDKIELQQRLEGKTKLQEIMAIVDDFYKADAQKQKQLQKVKGEEEGENEYLHWKRWEYYNRSRLGPNGEIININQRTWQAYNEFKDYLAIKQTLQPQSLRIVGSWIPIGPNNYTRFGEGSSGGWGRVNCIAFHPIDVNTFYIGTPHSGVWKTTDGGKFWLAISDDLPSNGISGIVVDYSNPNTIYILTGDGDAEGASRFGSSGVRYFSSSIGVLKSTDGGISWLKTGDFPGAAGKDYAGYKLVQHPSNPNIIFAATSLGIMRSINGGASWDIVQGTTSSGNLQDLRFTDIEFNPNNPDTMYAVSYHHRDNFFPFFRSSDGGQTWTHNGHNDGLPITGPSATRLAIGVTKNNPDYVYLIAGPKTGKGSFMGVYRSTNRGSTFTAGATKPNILGGATDGNDTLDQSGYDLAIEVDPDDFNKVITGGINLWRYSNDADTDNKLKILTHWVEPNNIGYVHADIHNLAYNPLDGKLYCLSDGGVGVSPDDGTTWTFISKGLQIMELYHATGYDADVNLILGGAQDNGTNFRHTSTSDYRHINGADGFDVIISWATANTLYFVGNDAVLRSDNQGASRKFITLVGGEKKDSSFFGFFPTLAQDVATSEIIYVGGRDGVWKSINKGDTWARTGDGKTIPRGNIALVTCPSDAKTLYCSDGSKTFRTKDAGANWDIISNKPGYPTSPFLAPLTLTAIGVSPNDSKKIWAVIGNFDDGKKVYRSTDGGDNWENVSGTLPNIPMQSIAVDKDDNVYIGSDFGVFYRGNNMNDWNIFTNGLARTPVTDLIINQAKGKIKAATFGRGIFETDLYSTCETDLVLSAPESGFLFYEVSNNITSTAQYFGGEGTEVIYRAGNSIILQPGFVVPAGNRFRAYLGPCGSGGNSQLLKAELKTESIESHTNVGAEENKKFPFGHIAVSTINNKQVTIRTDIEQPGNYSLVIFNEKGEKFSAIEAERFYNKGSFISKYDVSALVKGSFFVKLMMENKTVHIQELHVH